MSRYDRYGAAGASVAKAEKNCRSCTDHPASWVNTMRQVFHTATANKFSSNGGSTREDCPLDKSKLGGCTWGLLHTIAAFYPDKPTDRDKNDTRNFFDILTRIYPCEFCARDFQEDFKKHPINVNSQSELSQWLCQFHNRVNKKLNKPLFDCAKVDQRWRDGWLDGSCDE